MQTLFAQHSVHPTGGYAPRFQTFFLASSWFQQSGVISSHPKRLTRAVGQRRSHDKGDMQ